MGSGTLTQPSEMQSVVEIVQEIQDREPRVGWPNQKKLDQVTHPGHCGCVVALMAGTQ